MVEIFKSDINGRGVFATQNIPKGTELICDVVLIKKEYEKQFECINMYSFPWDREYYSICIGFASFFNHNRTPNVKNFKIDKINLKDIFVTIKDINTGEELFIDYGNKKLEFY